MEHIYYRSVFRLRSPLSLGSGLNDNTDSDVLLDSRKRPFIPATSIAGVIRHSIADKGTADRLFGSIEGEGAVTRVITYDAVCGERFTVTARDSVRLRDKVAEDTGKFDFEAVETGAEFVGYIEITDNADNADEIIRGALGKINAGALRFGHKTTRGYGAVEIAECLRLAFTDVDKWLDFDMFDGECWNSAEKIELGSDSETAKITLKLKQRGGLSIRSYTTKASDGEAVAPDHEQLSLKNGIPVIPGTSWAGAFRERFCEFTDETTRDELFGYIEGKKNSVNRKSRISFGESIIKNFESKLITRNSIDRYTCGTNDGALYTERTVYNGETELEITLSERPSDNAMAALIAVIADLDNGFLAVGGLTSVGRGLFSVEHIFVNGKDVTDDLKAYRFDKITEVIGNV